VSQTSAPPSRRKWLRYGALAAVVLVPLAFAGLFVGAVSGITHGIDEIPAAIVDNDTLVTQTAADGTKTQILAGRELVTQLTGKKSVGFSWTITNSKDAKADLAAGKVYAVLTVPKNFSKSIVSLSGKSPQQAKLSIATDDSHNYLTGSVAQVVGDSLTSAFGSAITKQYVAGLYSGFSGVGSSLATAGTGAGKLASGASGLSTGLGKISSGIGSAKSGATSLASGADTYVGGVSTLAGGLHKLAGSKASPGLTQYTEGISTISAALSQATAALRADPTNPVALGTVEALAPQLAKAAAAGPQLSGGLRSAASGASTLAAKGSSIGTGARSLAAGLGKLQSGTSSSAAGAKSLAGGATKLSSGLKTGAAKVPSYTSKQSSTIAGVISNPVGVNVTRHHEVSSPGQIIATLFIPLGLWVGSLAVFLVMRPITRRTLSSTAASGRLVLSAIGRASIITAAQAVLLVGLLHLGVGVSWALLPASLIFAILMAVAFTAFHYLLTIGLGRAGLVVSIFLLAVQITSTGGLYPIQLLATPFQVISPFLPLTYGVQGMQAIIANSGVASAIGASLALAVFGVGSLLIALLAVRRVRRARALGLVPSLA
jgi:putative membrane protein